uniref:CAP-Gly domain-containing protein n=1 Tax=Macrostomum lignano TaxID=282301 RepID=A0A1I8FXY5_9PLAT
LDNRLQSQLDELRHQNRQLAQENEQLRRPAASGYRLPNLGAAASAPGLSRDLQDVQTRLAESRDLLGRQQSLIDQLEAGFDSPPQQRKRPSTAAGIGTAAAAASSATSPEVAALRQEIGRLRQLATESQQRRPEVDDLLRRLLEDSRGKDEAIRALSAQVDALKASRHSQQPSGADDGVSQDDGLRNRVRDLLTDWGRFQGDLSGQLRVESDDRRQAIRELDSRFQALANELEALRRGRGSARNAQSQTQTPWLRRPPDPQQQQQQQQQQQASSNAVSSDDGLHERRPSSKKPTHLGEAKARSDSLNLHRPPAEQPYGTAGGPSVANSNANTAAAAAASDSTKNIHTQTSPLPQACPEHFFNSLPYFEGPRLYDEVSDAEGLLSDGKGRHTTVESGAFHQQPHLQGEPSGTSESANLNLRSCPQDQDRADGQCSSMWARLRSANAGNEAPTAQSQRQRAKRQSRRSFASSASPSLPGSPRQSGLRDSAGWHSERSLSGSPARRPSSRSKAPWDRHEERNDSDETLSGSPRRSRRDSGTRRRKVPKLNLGSEVGSHGRPLSAEEAESRSRAEQSRLEASKAPVDNLGFRVPRGEARHPSFESDSGKSARFSSDRQAREKQPRSSLRTYSQSEASVGESTGTVRPTGANRQGELANEPAPGRGVRRREGSGSGSEESRSSRRPSELGYNRRPDDDAFSDRDKTGSPDRHPDKPSHANSSDRTLDARDSQSASARDKTLYKQRNDSHSPSNRDQSQGERFVDSQPTSARDRSWDQQFDQLGRTNSQAGSKDGRRTGEFENKSNAAISRDGYPDQRYDGIAVSNRDRSPDGRTNDGDERYNDSQRVRGKHRFKPESEGESQSKSAKDGSEDLRNDDSLAVSARDQSRDRWCDDSHPASARDRSEERRYDPRPVGEIDGQREKLDGSFDSSDRDRSQDKRNEDSHSSSSRDRLQRQETGETSVPRYTNDAKQPAEMSPGDWRKGQVKLDAKPEAGHQPKDQSVSVSPRHQSKPSGQSLNEADKPAAEVEFKSGETNSRLESPIAQRDSTRQVDAKSPSRRRDTSRDSDGRRSRNEKISGKYSGPVSASRQFEDLGLQRTPRGKQPGSSVTEAGERKPPGEQPSADNRSGQSGTDSDIDAGQKQKSRRSSTASPAGSHPDKQGQGQSSDPSRSRTRDSDGDRSEKSSKTARADSFATKAASTSDGQQRKGNLKSTSGKLSNESSAKDDGPSMATASLSAEVDPSSSMSKPARSRSGGSVSPARRTRWEDEEQLKAERGEVPEDAVIAASRDDLNVGASEHRPDFTHRSDAVDSRKRPDSGGKTGLRSLADSDQKDFSSDADGGAVHRQNRPSSRGRETMANSEKLKTSTEELNDAIQHADAMVRRHGGHVPRSSAADSEMASKILGKSIAGENSEKPQSDPKKHNKGLSDQDPESPSEASTVRGEQAQLSAFDSPLQAVSNTGRTRRDTQLEDDDSNSPSIKGQTVDRDRTSAGESSAGLRSDSPDQSERSDSAVERRLSPTESWQKSARLSTGSGKSLDDAEVCDGGQQNKAEKTMLDDELGVLKLVDSKPGFDGQLDPTKRAQIHGQNAGTAGSEPDTLLGKTGKDGAQLPGDKQRVESTTESHARDERRSSESSASDAEVARHAAEDSKQKPLIRLEEPTDSASSGGDAHRGKPSGVGEGSSKQHENRRTPEHGWKEGRKSEMEPDNYKNDSNKEEKDTRGGGEKGKFSAQGKISSNEETSSESMPDADTSREGRPVRSQPDSKAALNSDNLATFANETRPDDHQRGSTESGAPGASDSVSCVRQPDLATAGSISQSRTVASPRSPSGQSVGGEFGTHAGSGIPVPVRRLQPRSSSAGRTEQEQPPPQQPVSLASPPVRGTSPFSTGSEQFFSGSKIPTRLKFEQKSSSKDSYSKDATDGVDHSQNKAGDDAVNSVTTVSSAATVQGEFVQEDTSIKTRISQPPEESLNFSIELAPEQRVRTEVLGAQGDAKSSENTQMQSARQQALELGLRGQQKLLKGTDASDSANRPQSQSADNSSSENTSEDKFDRPPSWTIKDPSGTSSGRSDDSPNADRSDSRRLPGAGRDQMSQKLAQADTDATGHATQQEMSKNFDSQPVESKQKIPSSAHGSQQKSPSESYLHPDNAGNLEEPEYSDSFTEDVSNDRTASGTHDSGKKSSESGPDSIRHRQESAAENTFQPAVAGQKPANFSRNLDADGKQSQAGGRSESSFEADPGSASAARGPGKVRARSSSESEISQQHEPIFVRIAVNDRRKRDGVQLCRSVPNLSSVSGGGEDLGSRQLEQLAPQPMSPPTGSRDASEATSMLTQSAPPIMNPDMQQQRLLQQDLRNTLSDLDDEEFEAFVTGVDQIVSQIRAEAEEPNEQLELPAIDTRLPDPGSNRLYSSDSEANDVCGTPSRAKILSSLRATRQNRKAAAAAAGTEGSSTGASASDAEGSGEGDRQRPPRRRPPQRRSQSATSRSSEALGDSRRSNPLRRRTPQPSPMKPPAPLPSQLPRFSVRVRPENGGETAEAESHRPQPVTDPTHDALIEAAKQKVARIRGEGRRAASGGTSSEDDDTLKDETDDSEAKERAKSNGGNQTDTDISSSVLSDEADKRAEAPKPTEAVKSPKVEARSTASVLLPDRPRMVSGKSVARATVTQMSAAAQPSESRQLRLPRRVGPDGFLSDGSIFSDDDNLQRRRLAARAGRIHLLALESSFETLYDPSLQRSDGLSVGRDSSRDIRLSSSSASENDAAGERRLGRQPLVDLLEAAEAPSSGGDNGASSSPSASDAEVLREMELRNSKHQLELLQED